MDRESLGDLTFIILKTGLGLVWGVNKGFLLSQLSYFKSIVQSHHWSYFYFHIFIYFSEHIHISFIDYNSDK